MKNVVTVILLSALFMACNDDEMNTGFTYDCQFVASQDSMDGQLDATEESIMTQCRENLLTSDNEIEENLIGEWLLVGHADGWRFNVAQPCAFIKISKNELEFHYENENSNTITIHEWEVVESSLKLTPENRKLDLTRFCENYIFGNEFVLDGDILIFEKVNN